MEMDKKLTNVTKDEGNGPKLTNVNWKLIKIGNLLKLDQKATK